MPTSTGTVFDNDFFGGQRKSRLWFHAESRCVDAIEFCEGDLASYSNTSPDKQSPNEDASAAFQLSESQGIIAVADGLGGHQAGDQAARMVIESLAQKLDENFGSRSNHAGPEKDSSLRPIILDAIEFANQSIIELKTGAAATIAIVEYDRGNVRCYHVGDSQIILCSNRGKIKFATVAHSPTGLAVESGMISESEAMNHDERNLINNCVGDKEMRIEIGPSLPMTTRDTLLVASDGLFDNLLIDEIVEIIRKGSLVSQTETLVAVAHQRMTTPGDATPSKPDDLTILCFRR